MMFSGNLAYTIKKAVIINVLKIVEIKTKKKYIHIFASIYALLILLIKKVIISEL